MSEADGKNRYIALIELSYLGNDGGALLRIAGAVGNHDSVRLIRKNLRRRRPCRVNRHIAAAHRKAADNIFLQTDIQKSDLQALSVQVANQAGALFLAGLVAVLILLIFVRIEKCMAGNRTVLRKILCSGYRVFLFAGNLLDHLAAGVLLQLRKNDLQIIMLIRSYHAVHGADLAKKLCERPGINSRNSGNIILLHKCVQALITAEI